MANSRKLVAGTSRNRRVTGWPSTNSRTASVSPESSPQLGHVERVLHEADVEDEVGLERDAVLVAEADELERELVRARLVVPSARRAARAAGGSDRSEVSMIDVGLGADRVEEPALPRDRAGDARARSPSGWRWRVSREAPDEDLVARLEEEDLGLDAAALERAAHRPERERRVAGAHVEHDRDAREALRVVGDRARRGRAAARRAGCRRPCSRGPRTACWRPSCRPPERPVMMATCGRRRPRRSARRLVSAPRRCVSAPSPGSDAASGRAADEQDRELVEHVHRAAHDDRADGVAAGRHDDREDGDAEERRSRRDWLQPLDAQDARRLRQHDEHDRELHDQPEDEEHHGHEAEVRLGGRHGSGDAAGLEAEQERRSRTAATT